MLFMRAFFFTLLAACALAAPFSALLRGARDVDDDWTPPPGDNYTIEVNYTDPHPISRFDKCGSYFCYSHMPEGATVRILEQEGAEKAVNMYCKAFLDVLSCSQKQAEECDAISGGSGLMIASQGVSDYICSGRGRQLAIQEADCVLPGERFEHAASGCYVDVSGDTCRDLDEIRVCIVNAMRDQCSDDAAEFTSQFIYYSFLPEATASGCELTAP